MKLSLETLKKFSLKLLNGFKVLFRRFPLTTSLLIIEFIGLVLLVELEYFTSGNNPSHSYLLGTFLLGNFSLILASIASQLTSEKLGLVGGRKTLAILLPLVLLAVVFSYFACIDYKSYEIISNSFTGNMYRQLVLVFLSGLSIFTVPFLKDTNSNEWWNFSVSSVFRASISILYSMALYIGLSLALLALDSFWEIKLFGSQYEVVAFFSFVLVAPLHFLHGLYRFPTNTVLVKLPSYLSIFVKYILTPLITIYVVILYPYIFSFPFRSEWPANESTGIILALHAMIYLGVVLFYGVQEGSADEKFKRVFTKVASIISIPTLIFWSYSLYLRIEAYGVTVNRFALMAIILWFLGTSIYLLFSKRSNPKYILGGLFTVIAVVFYFPFSSFYWGEKIQLERLVDIAKDEGLYRDGKIERGVETKVLGNDYTMGEITAYLVLYNRSEGVKNVLSDSIRDLVAFSDHGYMEVKSQSNDGYRSIDGYSFASIFFEKVSVSVPNPTETQYYTINLDVESVNIPDGYSSVRIVDLYAEGLTGNVAMIDQYRFEIDIDIDSSNLYLTSKLSDEGDVYRPADVRYTDDIQLMTFESGDSILIVRTVAGDYVGSQFDSLTNLTGYLFTK